MNRVEESPLPLSDVLSLPGVFETAHAVAIALQLVDQLSPRRGEPVATFPTVDRIALSPTGFLLTQLESWSGEPLAGLGRLFQQLLKQTGPSGAVRLLSMQAASVPPAIAFEDFVRELTKWDAPDRLDTLSNLYRRANSLEFRLELAAREKDRLRRMSGPVGARRSWLPSIGLVSAGVVAAGIAAAFLLETPEFSTPAIAGAIGVATAQPTLLPPGLPGSELQTATLDGLVEDPMRSAPSQPAGSGGAVFALEPLASSVVSGSGAPIPAISTVRLQQPEENRERGAAARGPYSGPEVAVYSPEVMREAEEGFRRAREAFERRDYASAASGFLSVVEVLERGDPTLELRQIAVELAAASRALSSNTAAEAMRVYTTADDDVVEPIARASLPPSPPPSVPADEVGVLELLIDVRGRVESAHLIGVAQHFRDRWLISAAKSWLFEPARKDGQPVRFLKRHIFHLGQAAGQQ